MGEPVLEDGVEESRGKPGSPEMVPCVAVTRSAYHRSGGELKKEGRHQNIITQ